MRWRRVPDRVLLGGLVLAGLAVRVWALSASAQLSADEAIPGLMARHIVSGRELPVFYYGQHYFGALEAYLVAALFGVFGFRPWLVVVPAVAASLALIPLVWALAEEVAPRPAGLLAALPIALPPPALARLFANAGGGFSLAYALQAAAVLCCLRAYRGGVGAARWASLFWLATGLAGWVWQPALLALPPLMLPVLIRHAPLRTPAALARTVAPAMIGLLPPLVYNAAQGWPTLTQLARYTTETQADDVWRVLFLALGGADESTAAVNPLLLVLVGAALLVTPVVLLRRARCTGEARVWRQRTQALGILLLFATLSALAAHQAVRHLLPVVLVGSVLAGALLALLPLNRAVRWVPAAVMVLVVTESLQLDARAPDLFAHETPSTAEVDAAVAALDGRGLRTGYADYWSAYPITYVSGERIILAPRLPPRFSGRVDRYPVYTQHVDAVETPTKLFALVDHACELAPYLDPLDRLGATYRVDRVARWSLVWDIQPPAGREREVLAAWRAALQARQTC